MLIFCFQLHAPKEAIKECNLALQLDENDVDALCDRAEAHILEDNFSEAVNDYQKAKSINDQLHKVLKETFLWMMPKHS